MSDKEDKRLIDCYNIANALLGDSIKRDDPLAFICLVNLLFDWKYKKSLCLKRKQYSSQP